jgi:hypothetical protein
MSGTLRSWPEFRFGQQFTVCGGKMNKSSNSDDWLQAELADTLDEDFELELSEPALSEEIRKIYKSQPPADDRARGILSTSSYTAGRTHQIAGLGSAHQGEDCRGL